MVYLEPFADWVLHGRATARSHESQMLYKFIGNRGIGRLGLRTGEAHHYKRAEDLASSADTHTTHTIGDDASRYIIVHHTTPRSTHSDDDAPGPIVLAGARWLPVSMPAPRTNRLWCAYIFAEQRCDMHTMLHAVHNPVYCHTDSIICASETVPGQGHTAGDWELQESGNAHVRGLGQYSMRTRQANRGDWLRDALGKEGR